MLGTKTYERVYTISGITEVDSKKIAEVDLRAIPSAQGAEALHKQADSIDLSQMSDNTEDYEGYMRFNLSDGKVQEYIERLLSKWTMVDTSKQDAEPAALTMIAIRASRVDKLD
jgi:hypothetical protein